MLTTRQTEKQNLDRRNAEIRRDFDETRKAKEKLEQDIRDKERMYDEERAKHKENKSMMRQQEPECLTCSGHCQLPGNKPHHLAGDHGNQLALVVDGDDRRGASAVHCIAV